MKPILNFEQANIWLIHFIFRLVRKKLDVSFPFLLNFCLDYAVRNAQTNLEEFKFCGTYHLLVCTHDITLFGESIRTIEENT